MAISLTDEKNTIYGKGDVCLTITPFDNFRKFTLYENWKSDDRKTLDISNSPSLYLVFKTKKKEIRIPEYTEYEVDKVNGEVLFKISKKNATDILQLTDNTFYITRVYEVIDSTGNNTISSDEEVLYTGKWKDESSAEVENYTEKIKTLLSTLEDRTQQIKDLQAANAELMEQNVDFATQIEEYKDTIDDLNKEVDDLTEKVASYESGNTYDAEVLDDNGSLIYVQQADTLKLKYDLTEEELKEALVDRLEETFNS